MNRYFYVYRIDNLVNGKYYIGKGSCICSPTDDVSYLGSGIALKKAIKKYGKDNFRKIILEVFIDENDAYDHEAKLVTMKQVKEKDCYNITTGGCGVGSGEACWNYGKTLSKKHRESISRSSRGREGMSGKNNPFYGRRHTEESLEKMRCRRPSVSGPNNPWFGKTLPAEIRQKMCDNHADIRGEKHPNARLTHSSVVLARLLHWEQNMPTRDISNLLKVGGNAIGLAVHGHSWIHVPMPESASEKCRNRIAA